MVSALLTLGQIAHRLGVPTWKARRLFERGLLPAAARVGQNRVFQEKDVPAIEKALREAGYLKG